MVDMWRDFVQAHGRIVGYATWCGNGTADPLPDWVPCDDWLVQECRAHGVPVYPVYTPTVEAT
jgi:hypothetical protein